MLINDDDDFKSNSELLAEPRRRRRLSDRGGACFCLFDQTRRGKPLRPVSDKAMTESESRFGASSVVGSSAAAAVGATRCATTVREGEAFAFSCVTVRGSGAGRGASKAPLSISESPIPWVEGRGTTVKDDPGCESSEYPGRCT
jgi:hypothetical protein